jgi:hypothetical protein
MTALFVIAIIVASIVLLLHDWRKFLIDALLPLGTILPTYWLFGMPGLFVLCALIIIIVKAREGR